MPFFRNTLNLAQAQLRRPTPDDYDELLQLIQRANYRLCMITDAELTALLAQPLGSCLWIDDQLVGMLLAGLSLPPSSWLRVAAIDNRLRLTETLPMLLDQLHRDARAQGVDELFFLSDPWAGSWLQAQLRAAGYRYYEEVVAYQKRGWETPPRVGPRPPIRPATLADLQHILAIDGAAFERRWVKLAPTLAEALRGDAFFLIAEHQGCPAGYAFVSLHFGGKLAHLVRIATLPELQGQGIGSALLDQVCVLAAQHQVETISLNTQGSNHAARRLYERYGFELTNERQLVLRFATAP